MTRARFTKQIGVGLMVLAWVGAGTAWPDKGDESRPRTSVKPLIQASGASPLPPFSTCGNFPGTIPEPGVNVLGSEVEPWVDVNPINPNNIVAFYQQDRWSNGGARSNVAGVSFDGGATWRTVIVPGLTDCSGGQFERATDPWISFSPNGVVHQMSLLLDIDPPSTAPQGFGPNGMAVSRSRDGGLTWSDPILIVSDTDPRFLNDKNSITADPKDSNLVYAVWDRLDVNPIIGFPFRGPAYFARTTNGGVSWEPARQIFDPGLVNQVIGAQILVLPDGTLLNFFNKIINVNPDGGLNPFPHRLTFIRSDDKGVTWDIKGGGTEIAMILALGVITPDLDDFVRDGAILFDVAVDPRSGHLYAVWQDFRFTGFDQIAFSQSKDGGRTWSNPIRVNQTPADPARPFTQQAFLPSVAVGGDGTVAVTHYDFRNDDDSGELADHWMIFCKTKCEQPSSWRGEIRLTTVSFDYLRAPFANGLFLGDYVGLAANRREFLSFFQQSSVSDPASGFFRKVLQAGHSRKNDSDD